MKLSSADFDKKFEAGQLCLAFIGMSNIGKSYTAMRLRKSHGFNLYEVDEAIQLALNLKSMQESADWMGFPYEDIYAAREAEYLELESRLTLKAFEQKDGNKILDTTGSIIYASADSLSALKDKAVIVHIQAGPENLARLESLYFRAPKPLIWAGQYKAKSNEDRKDSLRRCYPKLLQSRLQAYNDLADINLPASLLFEETTTADTLMEHIRKG